MKLYSPKKNLQKVFTILVFVLLLQNNGWGQASLPTTWDWTGTAPTGWTGTALGGTYTSAPFYLSAAVSGKYTAASQFFTIFFNSVPGVVTYNLYKNGTTTGYVFTVQESVDNITYTTLKSHTNALNALTNTTWVNFTATPLSTSRYIRFYYTTKDVNIAVDDISIGVPPTCPTLTGATQAAAVCAATAATINLTGLVASSTNNAIDYTINGVAQTQITGVNATVGGTASFTTPALAIGNNGQTLQITKITNGSCNTTFTQNVTLSVNAIPADPIGSISPAANPACVNTTLNYSAAAANFYWQTTAAGTNTLLPTTTDLTVSSNGTYYVRNYNGSCWSAGNVASAAITINTAPAAPVSSAASLITPTSFSANWAASATATTYYLDVCTDAGFTAFVTGYNNLNVGNVTTYSVTGLSSNVTYYYHVRASNACGTSANSGSQNTTTTKSATSDIISAGGYRCFHSIYRKYCFSINFSYWSSSMANYGKRWRSFFA